MCLTTLSLSCDGARHLDAAIVLSAKSDSEVMFCLQTNMDLESIDHLYINFINRI